MYYSFSLFNEEKLFLRFNGLKHSPSTDSKRKDEFQMLHNEFLFKADRLLHYLKRIQKLDEFIMQQAVHLKEVSIEENQKNPKNNPLVIYPKNGIMSWNTIQVNEFLGLIPPFLNTLVILQDRIMRIVALHMNIDNCPDNLKSIANNRGLLDRFGQDIKRTVLQYWKEGKKIQKYRNLDQHQFNFLSHYGVDSNGDFHAYLPDNPDERNYERISFKKKIDVLNRFEKEFEQFHEFTEKLMEHLSIKEEQHSTGKTHDTSTLESYDKGDCLMVVQARNLAMCVICSDIDKEGKQSLFMSFLPFTYNKFRMTISELGD